MLGVQEAGEDRHVFRVRELCEDHGEARAAKEVEEGPDLGDDVASGRNFHRLAGIEEGALHVHHNQRRPPGLQPQRLFERLRPVHAGPC